MSVDTIQPSIFKTMQALDTEVDNFDVLDANATHMINQLVGEIMLLLNQLATFNHHEVTEKKWDLLDMSELMASKQHKKGNREMEVAAFFTALYVVSFFVPNQAAQQSMRFAAEHVGKPASGFFQKYNESEMTILQHELSVLQQQIGVDLNKLNDQQKDQLLQVVASAIRLKSSQ